MLWNYEALELVVEGENFQACKTPSRRYFTYYVSTVSLRIRESKVARLWVSETWFTTIDVKRKIAILFVQRQQLSLMVVLNYEAL